jgi:hypothetical protein
MTLYLTLYPNQRYLDAFTLLAGRRDRFYDRVHYFPEPNPKYKHTLADFPPTIAAALNEELRDIMLGLKSFNLSKPITSIRAAHTSQLNSGGFGGEEKGNTFGKRKRKREIRESL